jgi:hypothetical protein
MWYALSDERKGLSFRIYAGPRQRGLHCFLYKLGTDHIENTASIVDETSLLLIA